MLMDGRVDLLSNASRTEDGTSLFSLSTVNLQALSYNPWYKRVSLYCTAVSVQYGMHTVCKGARLKVQGYYA